MQTASTDHVIVLHGIWMRGIAMLPLSRRLRAAGFSVDALDYPSVVGSWDDSASRLAEHWRQHGGRRVHVVGHSLGGDDPLIGGVALLVGLLLRLVGRLLLRFRRLAPKRKGT